MRRILSARPALTLATLLVAFVLLLGPFAAAVQAAPAAQGVDSAAWAGTTVYVVRYGDTLTRIALRFGVSTASICRLNNLPSCDRIYAGQRLLIPTAGDQEPTPPPGATYIYFASGATSATAEGWIGRNQVKNYVIEAGAGQLMMLSVDSLASDLRLTVFGQQDGRVLARSVGSPWTGRLPSTQAYVVQVIGGRSAADYALQVTIPRVIRFQPGAYSDTISGRVRAGSFTRQVLRAGAGQTMYVELSSPRDDVGLTMWGLDDGQPLVRAEAGGRTWSGTLPLTQDYVIDAVATGGSSSFTLFVEIY